METIMIAGLATVAVGGYYSFVDFMGDLGICGKSDEARGRKLPVSRLYCIASQPGIKKMAGMHI